MHFSRLRLTGFKSFVEATDFRIEPGLTGVVGPNGCGKSNLLEALRWVMGANSAKAMRGEGMDDVIFAGSGARPGRNHAEVTLTIDNADRTAPAAFNAQTILEVSRRIDRGEGSTFRVNGAEARARDIQLLFADCSTGANSPALVRQGQISELIAARPQNRRRVLEEAAGVSGLHGRRHEAELRVAAARTNLDRLDDLAGELEANLNRLRREARHAVRYRTLSAEIRTLQAALLRLRWREARAQVDRLEGEEADLGRAAEQSVLAAVAAARLAAEAEAAAIKPRREEEMIAAGVLGRLAIDRDRLERAMENAAEAIRRHGETLARLEADAAREARIAGDAATTLERLRRDIGEVEALIASAPRRGPELEAAARTAEEARALADSAVENLAALTAAARAEAAAGETRLAEARERHGRTRRALDRARGERRRWARRADPRTRAAADDLTGAEARLTAARADLETADDVQAQAARAEESARSMARAQQDALGRVRSEAEGLGRLLAGPADGRHAPVLERVTPEPGLEAAVAAVLGDDIDAALDPAAPSHWAAGRTPDQWLAAAQPGRRARSAPEPLRLRAARTCRPPRLHRPGRPGGRAAPVGDASAGRSSCLAPGRSLALGRLYRLRRGAPPCPGAPGTEDAPGRGARGDRGPRTARAARGVGQRRTRRVGRRRRRRRGAAGARGRQDRRSRRPGARGRPGSASSERARAARPRFNPFPRRWLDSRWNWPRPRPRSSPPRPAPRRQRTSLIWPCAWRLARRDADLARETAAGARAALDAETRDTAARARRLEELRGDFVDWEERASSAERRIAALAEAREAAECERAKRGGRAGRGRTAPSHVDGRACDGGGAARRGGRRPDPCRDARRPRPIGRREPPTRRPPTRGNSTPAPGRDWRRRANAWPSRPGRAGGRRGRGRGAGQRYGRPVRAGRRGTGRKPTCPSGA